MTTNVYIILDKRRKKADDTYPISFRLIHKRKSTTIPTGYAVEEKFWDDSKLKVKRGTSSIANITGFNVLLKKRENELLEKIIELDKNGELERISINELKDLLRGKQAKSKTISFTAFADIVIAKLKEENRYGNALSYTGAINFLRKYGKKRNILFTDITPAFLESLEKKYMSIQGNHYNGLSVYMRSIRALYNRAIAAGYVSDQYYPFRRNSYEIHKYQIKSEKTKKRAVSKEVIKQIENFDNGNETLIKYKQFFMFSFYTMGMNMIDMAFLRKHNVVNGVLVYKRRKTGKTYRVKLNNKSMDILNYFGYDEKKRNDLLFPLIKNPNDPEKAKQQSKDAVRRTNKYLKIISDELGLDTPLTTYVSRHSWATIADKAGIDRRIISQGLGHSDLATTNIYINDIQSFDDLSAANDLITE